MEFPSDINGKIVEGVLSLSSMGTAEVSIKIHRSNTKIILEVLSPENIRFVSSGVVGVFDGHFKNSDVPVKMKEIYITNITRGTSGTLVVGEATEGVVIGEIEDSCISISRSINTELPTIRGLRLGEYFVDIAAEKNGIIEKELYQDSRGTKVFQSTVTLSGAEKPKSVYESEICSLLRLVGVMLSSSLYTWRTSYKASSLNRTDHYWFNGAQGVGKTKVVHMPHEFIKCAFPIWNSLSQDMQQAIHVSSTYLATSSVGYLDSRMFSVFQAWELFANTYKKEIHKKPIKETETTFKSDRRVLVERLREVYEKWCKEYPESSERRIFSIDGLVSSASRIISKDAIDVLIEDVGLKTDKVRFDANNFRKISNTVRHTGMLQQKNEYGDDLDLYDNAKFAIELILFRMLGYDDFLRWHENEVSCFYKMEEFFYKAESK